VSGQEREERDRGEERWGVEERGRVEERVRRGREGREGTVRIRRMGRRRGRESGDSEKGKGGGERCVRRGKL
jgi:hypothetical protein